MLTSFLYMITDARTDARTNTWTARKQNTSFTVLNSDGGV